MHRGKPTVLGVASGAVAGSGDRDAGRRVCRTAVRDRNRLDLPGCLCYFADCLEGEDSAMMTRLTSWESTESGGVFGILATGLVRHQGRQCRPGPMGCSSVIRACSASRLMVVAVAAVFRGRHLDHSETGGCDAWVAGLFGRRIDGIGFEST